MRQAVMTAPGRIELRDAPEPVPGEGQVAIRVRRIGVCGSDVHVWHGKHPYTSYPVVQGHEFSGQVQSVGEGVDGIRPGQRVTALPQQTCGRCGPCRRGAYHICDDLKVEGFQAPGCAQTVFVTDADRIVSLPEAFTFEQGALVEPVAVAAHAVARAGDLAGANVVVLGAGPIGNLVGQVARARGAEVLITDLSDRRLAIARDCGLPATSNADNESLSAAAERVFGDAGFAVALDCVGAEATMASAIDTIQKGGAVVVVGVFPTPPRVDLGLVQDRELELRGTLMYRREDYEAAVALIVDGAVATDPLISGHYPFEDYARAYVEIDAATDRPMKVFIDL